MQCPNCALYHPSRYSNCVSCGTKLIGDGELIQKSASQAADNSTASEATGENTRGGARSAGRGGMPTGVGIAIAGFILCASAGGTFFFFTKPPENERFLQEGQRQLQLGQYAFAVKTLSQAVQAKPNDGKALLALARAYVGVDQVDKAWGCISQAQQLGTAVVAEPELASDLANYYRQRNQYDKAVELLRPLAQGNVHGKKAELADLDATWGDEAIRTGNYRQAMRCWEEVKELHDGSRFVEADSRLATIYQKIAEEMLLKHDDEEALKFYTKLNVTAPSATSFEKTAEIYERQGKLELAIDQMRQSLKHGGETNSLLNHKLSLLMVKRGKELLDSGEADSGYGYLQQAQSLDPRLKAPAATVSKINFNVDPAGSGLHVAGEVWNPGQEPLNLLSMRAELFDKKAGKVLWMREHRVIDEFVEPLPGRTSKPFQVICDANFEPASSELRIYLNGGLYKSYPLSKVSGGTIAGGSPGSTETPLTLRPRIVPPTQVQQPVVDPQPAPNTVPTSDPVPPVAPNTVPNPGTSAEEKTLKDLD